MAFAGIRRPRLPPADAGKDRGEGGAGGVRRDRAPGRGCWARVSPPVGGDPRRDSAGGREAGVDADGREEASMGSATRRRIRRQVFSATGGIPGRLGRRCGGGEREELRPAAAKKFRWDRWFGGRSGGGFSRRPKGIPRRLGRRCEGREREPELRPAAADEIRWDRRSGGGSGGGFSRRPEVIPEAIPGRCGGRSRRRGAGSAARRTRGRFDGVSVAAARSGAGFRAAGGDARAIPEATRRPLAGIWSQRSPPAATGKTRWPL